MAASSPTAIRIRDRKINRRRVFFFPNSAGNLFAVQQIMFDAGVNAAPVTAVDGFVNHAANFYINPIPAQNPVVNPAEQIEQAAFLPLSRAAGWFLRFSPDFGFVWRHGGSLIHS